ncbi:MAG: heavy-metal-associated domain-containing protein [Saprospiraceae bacterium]|jgi:copper chaperone|nr:heavy-metal-associated domain-containing protein [Saprospiraceae bacterium]MBK8887459.1 heavy-metal-associated domain-containing protein [Saprospiraceae bacterium]MBK9742772.1 heavy-metal-associated domain-containing protein [Saprospiraceae bacterium]MBP6539856.1 heavy-metal-associated domain-containing protein [Saprospiraceae bacterium]MBP9056036.1 heavy-metal-associated domain-containing protein [Saprospiraceae bacterium]
MEIKVENIKCHGCANTIKNGLLKIKGVEQVQVNVEKGTIDVEGKDEIDRDEIVSRLHSMGYPEPGQGSGLTTATSFVSCMIGRVTS